MRTIHKAAAIAAAVVVAALVGVGVVHYTSSQDPLATIAAGDLGAATQDAANLELRSAMEESAVLQDGGQTGVDVSLPEALDAGVVGGAPDGVVVEPAHCLTYLSRSLGDPQKAAGWVQMGVRPELQSHYSALLASVPGGVSPDDLLAKLDGCESGTLVLEDLGVTGEFSISVVDVPDVAGAQTLGLLSKTAFPEDIAEEELAQVLGCATSEQRVTEASQVCSDPRVVSAQEISAARQTMSFYSNEYYFVYVMDGEILAESCEVKISRATEVARELVEGAAQRLT